MTGHPANLPARHVPLILQWIVTSAKESGSPAANRLNPHVLIKVAVRTTRLLLFQEPFLNVGVFKHGRRGVRRLITSLLELLSDVAL